ncbi:MAG: hypothetical protein R3F11_33085 [Verrucomicrobiales bacterium]
MAHNRPGVGYYLQVSDDLAVWKTVAASIDGSDAAGVGGGVVLSQTLAEPGVWRVVVRARPRTARRRALPA